MKFSRNLISQFINLSKTSNDALNKTLNNIGLEVESIYKISMPTNVVIGKVLDKQKHPNADKLSVCKVDIGSEILQIVCGAKNVAKEQFVPVALNGAKLPPKDSSQAAFIIKKSELRGVESNGMICSAKELGLPNIEDGIFVLDNSIGELILGKEIGEYEIFNDSIFELSITPNRGDCLSLFGIARDLSVALNIELKKIKTPLETEQIGIGNILNITASKSINSNLFYKIIHLQSLNCTCALKLNLALLDMLSPNILANILNFSSYITGVVLRAYCLDSFMQKDKKITLNIAKNSNEIESVFLKDVELSRIGIDFNTQFFPNNNAKLIAFEASYIAPKIISEIIFNNNLVGDSSTTFLTKRGSNPDLNFGMDFLIDLISKHSKSIIYSSHQELSQKYNPNQIDCTFLQINSIIGKNLKNENITHLIQKLGCNIAFNDNNQMRIIPPQYRSDIENLQDISEEILRFVGIDNIESIPQNIIPQKNIDENYLAYKFRRQIAKNALDSGFYECIHYIFTKKESLENLGYEVLMQDLDLKNPINNDLNTLRSSLVPELLKAVARNNCKDSINLFELGSIYNAKREEKTSLAIIASGFEISPIYPFPKGKLWDFYSFANAICNIVGEINLESSKNEFNSIIFHPNMSAKIYQNNTCIGILGKIHPNIAQTFDISQDSFICEIDFNLISRNLPRFSEFSRFQESVRDLSILVKKDIAFSSIKESLKNLANIKEIIPLDIYESPDLGENISLSFRIIFQAKDKTLNENELKTDEILQILETNFGAKLR